MDLTGTTHTVAHRLVFTLGLPEPLIYVLVCASACLVWLSVSPTLSRPMRLALRALRLSWAALALTVALLPQWTTEEVHTPKPHVALVLDNTGSMHMPLGGGPPRWEAANAWAQQAQRALADGHGPLALSLHNLGGAAHTDLVAGLSQIIKEQADEGPEAQGVVLVSDGQDHALGAPQSAEADAALKNLAALGVPISTVAVPTRPTPWRDVAITQVHHDPYGYIKNTVQVDVVLKVWGASHGPSAASLEVTLTEDGVVVARSFAAPQDGEQTVRLSFVPKAVGTFAYEVSVAPLAHEATLVNNRYGYLSRVVRDKIRVLHVSGRPSWDQRFLRETLKAQHQVDLVSFYILRSPYSNNTVPESELSLIPFPVERLFTTELKNFDVVVFQNFDSRPFRMEGYLPNVAQAVQDGLGLMMVGGTSSFALGGYGGTALEQVMPTLAGDAVLWPGPGPMQATPQGASHAVLNLCGPQDEGPWCLPKLPKLARINALGPAHPDATTLATVQLSYDTDGDGGAKVLAPLLVSRDAGKGRTLALATDTLWHWQVHDGPTSPGARAYGQFWRQALLWLTHDPETLPLRVVPSQGVGTPDEPMNVALTWLQGGSDLGRDAGVPVALFVEPVAGPAPLAAALAVCKTTFNQEGQATCRLPGLAQGAYRLRAHAETPHGPATAQAVVVMQNQSVEIQELRGNPELMARISHATGGAVLPVDSPQALMGVPTARAPKTIVMGQSQLPLYTHQGLLALVVTLFVTDVLLRRRLGLP